MWSVEYVQVPKEESSSPLQEEEKDREKERREVTEGEEEGPKQRVHKQMVKQMSISAEFTATEEGECNICYMDNSQVMEKCRRSLYYKSV